MENLELTKEEYQQLMESRKKKQLQQPVHETLEVKREPEKELTLNDLVDVKEDTENLLERDSSEEDYVCGSCGAVITNDLIKCANCGEELVWQ